jgi:hypothetical protein
VIKKHWFVDATSELRERKIKFRVILDGKILDISDFKTHALQLL